MKLTDFDYFLPQELIAQKPVDRRDASRLMVVDRCRKFVTETSFSEIVQMFRPGDLLVLNNTRVIPARLIGKKQSGGRIEIFLVRKLVQEGEIWQCLVKCSKKPL